MTAEEIDRMEAGAELDAMVAEHVMKWKVYRNRFAEELPDDDGEHCVVYLQRNAGQVYSVVHFSNFYTEGNHFEPSTNIADAWQVVEKVGLSMLNSKDGYYAIKPSYIERGTVRGTDYPKMSLIGGVKGEHWEPAPTAPLAICRAALKAVAAK